STCSLPPPDHHRRASTCSKDIRRLQTSLLASRSVLPLQLLSECMAISAENGRVEKAARSRQAVACADKLRYLVVALSLCSSADEHTGACAKPYADATKRDVPFPFPTRNVFALQPSLGSQSVSCQIPSSLRGRGGCSRSPSPSPSPSLSASVVDGTTWCMRQTGHVWRNPLSRNTRLLLTSRA
ncbi:hypothetical protein MUK42_12456, partial [Musa troglodytarum]